MIDLRQYDKLDLTHDEKVALAAFDARVDRDEIDAALERMNKRKRDGDGKKRKGKPTARQAARAKRNGRKMA